MRRLFSLFLFAGYLLAAAASCGDDSGEPLLDAAPDAAPKPPSKLVCPSESGAVAFSEGYLVGANSTHVIYLDGKDLMAWPGEGDAKRISAAPSTGWGLPQVSERALFLQTSERSFVVTEIQTGASRTITLPANRVTYSLEVVGAADTAYFLTRTDATYPASTKPQRIERYRLGAEAPEPVITLDEDDEGNLGYFDVEGDVLVWSYSIGEVRHVKKRILSTGEETELFTVSGSIDSFQIAGPWLFLGERFPPTWNGLRRYSLADGSLQVTYPGPMAAPGLKRVALVGDRLFAIGDRLFEIGTGCPIPSALYEMRATGAQGTLTVLQANGDRLVVGKGGLGFFSYVSGGGCGGHGNTGGGAPIVLRVGCFKP